MGLASPIVGKICNLLPHVALCFCCSTLNRPICGRPEELLIERYRGTPYLFLRVAGKNRLYQYRFRSGAGIPGDVLARGSRRIEIQELRGHVPSADSPADTASKTIAAVEKEQDVCKLYVRVVLRILRSTRSWKYEACRRGRGGGGGGEGDQTRTCFFYILGGSRRFARKT